MNFTAVTRLSALSRAFFIEINKNSSTLRSPQRSSRVRELLMFQLNSAARTSV
jgi:hypothetical protein